jgi:hypothetical protein
MAGRSAVADEGSVMNETSPPIDRSRRDLIEEFRRRPVGRHSPDLRLLLNQMRMSEGKEACLLICTRPHREWRLARKTTDRGSSVTLVPGVVFHSPEEAEWEMFKQRWKELTGESLT